MNVMKIITWAIALKMKLALTHMDLLSAYVW